MVPFSVCDRLRFPLLRLGSCLPSAPFFPLHFYFLLLFCLFRTISLPFLFSPLRTLPLVEPSIFCTCLVHLEATPKVFFLRPLFPRPFWQECYPSIILLLLPGLFFPSFSILVSYSQEFERQSPFDPHMLHGPFFLRPLFSPLLPLSPHMDACH